VRIAGEERNRLTKISTRIHVILLLKLKRAQGSVQNSQHALPQLCELAVGHALRLGETLRAPHSALRKIETLV
jgi:hypothetical protein